ncbi:MAG: ferritin-like domain-containing protein [Solirubrobacteraceae bacterium]
MTLEELDCDGAIREAAASVDGTTRAVFMRRTAAFLGGGAIVAGLPVAFARAAGGLPAGDVAILNYALTLEYLEAAFYAEAVAKGALTGETKIFAGIVADHEAQHVAALQKTLGSSAVKKPEFNFQGTTSNQSSFQTTAMTLEDTGVKAYLGQAGNIKTPAVLQAAGSILPVEARHAAWIENIIGHGSGNPSPAPDAFQPSATMADVLSAVKGTGFITNVSSASAGKATPGQPSLTG